MRDHLDRSSNNAALSVPPSSTSDPAYLRIGGLVFRVIFLCTLIALTARVSIPQNERLWTVYETAGDLVRLALGLVVCIALGTHLFRTPREPSAPRTWFYFGLTGLPFILILAAGVW